MERLNIKQVDFFLAFAKALNDLDIRISIKDVNEQMERIKEISNDFRVVKSSGMTSQEFSLAILQSSFELNTQEEYLKKEVNSLGRFFENYGFDRQEIQCLMFIFGIKKRGSL